MAQSEVFSEVNMDLETPKKVISPEPTTPRRSERKRALFPSASPQTSDLGHMSPLGSSPDRYSSAPASPSSLTYSPERKPLKGISPFGRKVPMNHVFRRISPRKQFSLLLNKAFKDDQEASGKEASNQKGLQRKQVENTSMIVPADQLEQTVLSVMEESDCPDSPDQALGTTPHNKDLHRDLADVKSAQPLTPSKRRSMPAFSSGSTTSTSPHSPERKRKLSLDSRSRSAGAELPRARTSLFSVENRSSGKRSRDDGIYLTGRNIKRRKIYGEINAGVRTGIKRPPKPKPKQKLSTSSGKKVGEIKSIWDVAPKTAIKRKSVNNIGTINILTQSTKVSDGDEVFSASAHVSKRSKQQIPTEQKESETEDETDEVEQEQDPNKKVFKASKPRTAFISLRNNYTIKVHKGKFTVEKASPKPPAKRRRQLYSQDKQIADINSFDDNDEDVAASTRADVQSILQKLEEDKSRSPESNTSSHLPLSSAEEISRTEDSTDTENSPQGKGEVIVPSSPQRPSASPSDGLMSPLSQLASSTSTLSIDVGGDTVHLTEAQVQALSTVPDVIMEEDDLVLCEPLPVDANEAKENKVSSTTEATPEKYFPIFNSNFSHQKLPVSPAVAKRKRSLLRSVGNDQYQLDAGQKRFGSTECGSCKAVYQMGEPDDELAHKAFHEGVMIRKFPGWKNEHVVGELGRNRIVAIRPGDPKSWWQKGLDILNFVDKDLGYAEGVNCDPNRSMMFLYISDKTVIGCILAIPLKKANRMIETAVEAEGIDCCTAEEYDVKCGISRIWVHEHRRRQGVASQMMNSLRKNFIFGHVLTLDEIAFSSPTDMGKVFAENYTGRKDYNVYTAA